MFRTDPTAGRRGSGRWIARRLAVLLVAFALAGVAVAGRASSATPHLAAGSPKLAGAFVNWGPVGRERMLRGWEKWLNQAPTSVVGVDFYAENTWDDFTRLNWVPGVWKKLNPERKLVWSIPLTVKGTPLREVADGLHDAEFEAAAQAISDAQPNAVIRLGWEMNLASMAWFAGGQEADYIAAFRRVVGIFRRYSGSFKYDWCPGWGAQDSPADLAYPGDDVVDYVGLDVYDFNYAGPAGERWEKFYLKAPFGLQWHREFAARHGKSISFPEWGVGNSGDNPLFVQNMHDWFVANADRIAYAAYFDAAGLWPTQIDNGRFPNSQRLFRELFGRRS